MVIYTTRSKRFALMLQEYWGDHYQTYQLVRKQIQNPFRCLTIKSTNSFNGQNDERTLVFGLPKNHFSIKPMFILRVNQGSYQSYLKNTIYNILLSRSGKGPQLCLLVSILPNLYVHAIFHIFHACYL